MAISFLIKKPGFHTLLLSFFFLPLVFLFSDYPRISLLTSRDVLFAQLQNEILQYHRATARNSRAEVPSLKIFEYTPCPSDTLFSLAARLNIPYDTLATLNRVPTSMEFSGKQKILIPNIPGIFVPSQPDNPLEEIMISWRNDPSLTSQKVIVVNGEIKILFNFYPGLRFHNVERAYFLRILFRLPIDNPVKTSSYGSRRDPFSGGNSFHSGIDLGAPVGTPVLAARDGTVTFCGYNEILGNYIIISHSGGYETVYGHLSAFLVATGSKIQTGTIIGRVGMTGRTTGPHLHFEIRQKGVATDPENLLP
ncbi:MAG: M23 family metallopeptidase [Spirochaetaceae bacterium]|nr:MAG: M23 family metallopeptidase [Spirochaetaceae bacterium]